MKSFLYGVFSFVFFTLVAGFAFEFSGQNAQAQALVTVPSGNRNITQPVIPASAYSRTRETKGDFDKKYKKVRDMIAKNRQLQTKIKRSAAKFDIDPVHIIGALVGEHTYNVDALDRIQTYVIKAASYFDSGLKFAYDGEKVSKFVKRPQFATCNHHRDSYRLWSCREQIWKTQFRGKNIGGKNWPKDRFGRVFFQPLYAGQTFGLGQLNPLAALRVNDLVVTKTRGKRLSSDRAGEVYKVIMEPDTGLDYMAAILRMSIDSYARIAEVDISQNPGLTATLYNLGHVIERAEKLAAKRAADPSVMPQENYYGWLVNDRLDELKQLVR